MQPEFIAINDPRQHYEDEVVLCFKGSNFIGVYSPLDKELDKLGGKEYKNEVLLDKNIKKFFVPYVYQFGHFLMETLSAIVLNLERDKTETKRTTLIVPPVGPSEKNNQTGAIQVVSYISNYLSSIGKPTEKIPDLETDEEVILVRVVNLELQPTVSFNAWSVRKVRDFCRSLPEIKDTTRDKKLYLSRGATNDSDRVLFSELKFVKTNENSFPPNYLRIANEVEVAKFLKQKSNIEVLVPEKIQSFGEQISIFSLTKLVVSPTSSSLFNMLFMPENSTVIELVTPLTVFDHGREQFLTSFHNHYSLLSFICGINYIGLPHNRETEQVIDKLDKYVV